MVQSSVISGVILKNTSNESYATFILIKRYAAKNILNTQLSAYSMYNLQESPGFRSFPGQAAAMRHLKTVGRIRRAAQSPGFPLVSSLPRFFLSTRGGCRIPDNQMMLEFDAGDVAVG